MFAATTRCSAITIGCICTICVLSVHSDFELHPSANVLFCHWFLCSCVRIFWGEISSVQGISACKKNKELSWQRDKYRLNWFYARLHLPACVRVCVCVGCVGIVCWKIICSRFVWLPIEKLNWNQAMAFVHRSLDKRSNNRETNAYIPLATTSEWYTRLHLRHYKNALTNQNNDDRKRNKATTTTKINIKIWYFDCSIMKKWHKTCCLCLRFFSRFHFRVYFWSMVKMHKTKYTIISVLSVCAKEWIEWKKEQMFKTST